jgi:hypothetical protein
MVRIALVTDSWSKVVEVEDPGDVIEAEGMTWERAGLHPGAAPSGPGPAGIPRYVPAVSA